MSKNYENEKAIKLLVNIVEKEETIEEVGISHVFSKNKLNEESINLSICPNLEIKDKKDDDPDEKIKNDIKELVRNKMKDLENNIVLDIYKSIKTQMNLNEEKVKTFDLNQNDIIHKDIKCNNCGKENIKGIRYKCLQCPNFNL